MAITIIETVGGASSNSYATMAEIDQFLDERMPLVPAWTPGGADAQKRLALMACQILEQFATRRKVLIPAANGQAAYYKTGRYWTGLPASTTQRLSWPRTGMFDRNGNAISSSVIPTELKRAQAELAGQLGKADLTLDNDVIVQGLTGLRVGSVSLSFKDTIWSKNVPDAVINLLIPGWLYDEGVEPAMPALFDVVSD